MNRNKTRTSSARPSHFSRIARPAGGSPHYLEALESRQLLTVTYGVELISLTTPTHLVTGAIAKGSLKFSLANISADAGLPSDTADIHVVAHPHGAADATGDVTIGSLLNQSINLGANTSKPFSVNLTLPANTPAAAYDVIVNFNKPAPAGSLIVSATVVSSAFTEEAQSFDLATTLGTSTIPTTLVAGGTVVGTVQVKLTNNGNISSASTEKATIQLFARPVGGGADVALTTSTPLTNLAVGNVKPLGFKLFTPKVIFPTTVTTGNYQIVAIATTTGPTTENNAGNDTAVSGQTLAVTQGFLDFSTSLVGSVLPSGIITGTADSGSVQLKVTNIGNIPAGATDKVTISAVAHPVGGGSDIPLGTLANQSISKIIAHTGFKPFTLKLPFTSTMPAGTYQIVVTTTANGPGVDINSSNNSFTAPATVIIAPAFVDMSIVTATTTVAGSVLGGTSGPASITLKNNGNVSSTGYLVEVFATSNGTIAGGATPIGTINSSTAKIAAGATLKLPVVNFTLPTVGSNTAYTLVARVTLAGDTNAGNNTATLGTVTATATPPVLGNEPSSVTFAEQTFSDLGLVKVSTGDVTHPGHALPAGDFYNYNASSGPGESKIGRLVLAVSPFSSINLTLAFTGTRLNSLNGKTITFLPSAAGSSGKFTVVGANVLAGVANGQTGFFSVA